jgi:DMSO/TMAO reductase YedYZ molybdopterin-dependent catalytic subunit
MAIALLTTFAASGAAGSSSTVPAKAVAEPGAVAQPVKVRGQVGRPRSFDMARLRGLPQHTVSVRYQTSKGAEEHRFTGPLLSDVLALAKPRIDPGVNNAQLRLFVTATGCGVGRDRRGLFR